MLRNGNVDKFCIENIECVFQFYIFFFIEEWIGFHCLQNNLMPNIWACLLLACVVGANFLRILFVARMVAG